MKNGGLTISVIFEAMSLNYGEGVGNISELKKLTREGRMVTYMSRQALRYELFRVLKELFGGREAPLDKAQDVIQFKEEANIKDYEEIDFFGYMKTKRGEKASTRSAVVRFSPAISLEPYLNDLEFGSNKNFADRLKTDPNIFQFEQHYSLYTYTLSIDLNRIGVDSNDNIELPIDERIRRTQKLLDAIKLMNREIKGRIENLNPVFIIGGVYPVKNPFFLNRLRISFDKALQKFKIDETLIESVLNIELLNGEKVKDYTRIGLLKGYWANEEALKEALDIESFFNYLKERIRDFYASS